MAPTWLPCVPCQAASCTIFSRDSHEAKAYEDGIVEIRHIIEAAASPVFSDRQSLARAFKERLTDAHEDRCSADQAEWVRGLVAYANGLIHQQICRGDMVWLEGARKTLATILTSMDRTAEGTASLTQIYALQTGGLRDCRVAKMLLKQLSDATGVHFNDGKKLQRKHLQREGRSKLRSLHIQSH